MKNTSKSNVSALGEEASKGKLELSASDLNSIPYLIQIAKHGSINQAANALFISTPALSNKIKKLEESLGQKLLVRTSFGSTLTEYGKKVVEAYKPILKDLSNFSEQVNEVKENSTIIKEDTQIIFPVPFPNSSVTWQLVADPISDSTLTFNFTPDGIPGIIVDHISMVYKFDSVVSLLNMSRIDIDLSFLSGDFNQIDMEFHGEDSNNNMNIYPPPVNLLRKSPDQSQYTYSFLLKDTFKSDVLERLREICFVVPLHVILKAKQKKGSFRINSISIK